MTTSSDDPTVPFTGYGEAFHGGFAYNYDGPYLDQGRTGSEAEAELRSRPHMKELLWRLRWCSVRASSDELRKELPALSYETVFVPAADLVAVSQEAAKEAKKMGRNATGEWWGRIIKAGAQKRPWMARYVARLLQDDRKILCFCGLRGEVEKLFEAIQKFVASPAWAAARQRGGQPALLSWVHGGGGSGPIKQVVEDYMAYDGPAIIVCTYDTLGQSYNLQHTHDLVMAQLPLHVLQAVQAIGRVSRPGQKYPARVIMPMAEGTADMLQADHLRVALPKAGAVTGDSELSRLADQLGAVSPEQEETMYASFLSRVLQLEDSEDE